MAENGGDNPIQKPPGPDAIRLSRAVARGDEAALAEFYRLWFDRCYAAARRITRRDEAFCLDVVQESMLKVVRSMRPMRSQAELDAWMGRVVRSVAVDMLRKQTRREARERRAMGTRGVAPSPAVAAVENEGAAWARGAMAGLPADDRALLADRLGRDRSLDEAGAAAGLSGDAAHGQVRRAVARLRAMAREVFDER